MSKRKGDEILKVNKKAKVSETKIRPSSLGNYVLNDSLVDYINYIKPSLVDPNIQFIMEQGNVFENELVKILEKKHKIYKNTSGTYE